MISSNNGGIAYINKPPSQELKKEVKNFKSEIDQKFLETEQKFKQFGYKYPSLLSYWFSNKIVREKQPSLIKIVKTIFFIISFLISGYVIIGSIIIYFYPIIPDIESQGLGYPNEIKNIFQGLPALIIIPAVYWLLIDVGRLIVFLPLQIAEKIMSIKRVQEKLSEKINLISIIPNAGVVFFFLLPLLLVYLLPYFSPENIFSLNKYYFSILFAICFYLVFFFLAPIWNFLENIRTKMLIKKTPKEVLEKLEEIYSSLTKLETIAKKAEQEEILIQTK